MTGQAAVCGGVAGGRTQIASTRGDAAPVGTP